MRVNKKEDPLPCPFCGARLIKRGNWWIYDHKINDCILDNASIASCNLGEWNRRSKPENNQTIHRR